MAPLVRSNPLEDQTHRPHEARGMDTEIARDHRLVPMRGLLVENSPSVEVEALPMGQLVVIGRLEASATGSRSAEGSVTVQSLQNNDPATPFNSWSTIHAPLENGVARFTDLPQGVLLVGLHVGSDPPHRKIWVNSRVRGARLDFEFGNARIYGQVRAADGTAVQGARVRITRRNVTVVALCGADGSYDGGNHFPAGRYTVEVDGHPIAGSSPLRTVDLGAGSSHEVSFGPGSDLSRWTGRVLAPDGQFVTASDGLPTGAIQLVAREGRGKTMEVSITDGLIDQWYEQDLYALRQNASDDGPHSRRRSEPFARLPYGPSENALSAIDLSTDLARDVQLEGFVLSGRIATDGNGANGIDLSLVAPRGPSPSTVLHAAVGLNGDFRFVGLAPGTYTLIGSKRRLASVSIDPHGPITTEVEL